MLNDEPAQDNLEDQIKIIGKCLRQDFTFIS